MQFMVTVVGCYVGAPTGMRTSPHRRTLSVRVNPDSDSDSAYAMEHNFVMEVDLDDSVACESCSEVERVISDLRCSTLGLFAYLLT